MTMTESKVIRDHTVDTRRDSVAHLKIEQARLAERTEGTLAAAQQLVANGVQLHVARRVLVTGEVRAHVDVLSVTKNLLQDLQNYVGAKS